MKPDFFPVPGKVIGHVVLLELIRLSRIGSADGNEFHRINMDYEVSCETSGDAGIRTGNDLPVSVQRVLADTRAGVLIDALVASGAVRVLVDLHVLQRRCELIERQWHDEHLLRAFVRAQASVPMIRRFFRTATRAMIGRLRREMDVVPPAKPRMPATRETDALLARWDRLRRIADPRERYLALHGECSGAWSLASLFAVVDSATRPDAVSSRRVHSSPNSREFHHVRHAPRPGGQPAPGKKLE
ncbi:MAG: hypothetical protein PCALPYG88_5683 [uncultured Paraburkholderia sp.]|uniref:hypothetical protein n=1 Tax=uncultured Paraburkholderia sp. TaxID=1822466 RepID=UPI0025990BFC|nr:hypothetical protein [uncultured Paraburkholderia sp.]CAH2902172.1 MAG: hypothetical protein PCALPYG08_5861 [uncultured Paraburkholderia sp.]CAH2936405.1 MAG: hypothetical protein PCALPYG88_5683 [uncultured Paraburkholderia sp.]